MKVSSDGGPSKIRPQIKTIGIHKYKALRGMRRFLIYLFIWHHVFFFFLADYLMAPMLCQFLRKDYFYPKEHRIMTFLSSHLKFLHY